MRTGAVIIKMALSNSQMQNTEDEDDDVSISFVVLVFNLLGVAK